MYVSGERIGPLFHRGVERQGNRIRTAMREASWDAANEIEALGADDIEAAGNFGDRWTEGLHADVSEGGGNIRISVWNDVPYWTIFEYGGIINGKPLLAIPLSFAADAQGLYARNFPGGLFRIDRKDGGKPLLLSIVDRQPKYFLTPSVTMPKKFHIRDIVRKVAGEMRDYFKDRMDDSKDG